jgi:hypothetical protein
MLVIMLGLLVQHFATGTEGHILYNGTTERLRIDSSGNVGIGTNAPKAFLHVTGKTIINSTLTGAPSNGLYGSDGTRLILWPGAVDNVPYSFGLAGCTLW